MMTRPSLSIEQYQIYQHRAHIPTSSARNIGVIFDSTFQMDAQDGKVCQACYFWLQKHSSRKVALNTDGNPPDRPVTGNLKTRLLQLTFTKNQLTRLQRVHNATARGIACIPRHEHISEIRMQLHWLPIQQIITYKILLLTSLVVHEKAPDYLSELLVLHKPNRALRSAN